MEETILTRGSRDVSQVSQCRSETGKSSRAESVTQGVESDTNVMDSTTTKQREGGEELDKG